MSEIFIPLSNFFSLYNTSETTNMVLFIWMKTRLLLHFISFYLDRRVIVKFRQLKFLLFGMTYVTLHHKTAKKSPDMDF